MVPLDYCIRDHFVSLVNFAGKIVIKTGKKNIIIIIIIICQLSFGIIMYRVDVIIEKPSCGTRIQSIITRI